ncbi:MAG: tRNA (guanosine(46)-N7)-methyltransferase TrmB [Candidatus Eisenbacteria bacterium]|nr:tRNA (guanosine(46)-N7)-methyltransferase TrmB [Candidatus Eisenbacteria bacterium]
MDDTTRGLPGVLDLRDLEPPLRWEGLFAVPVEGVEIEIGSGKGMFLKRASAERPGTGFLGVERAAKWFALGAARLAKEPRPNLRVVQADAFDLLVRWVPPGSVRAVHVYFPDPWPKKRHAKRRLLVPALFDLAARALVEGGWFQMATDVAPYLPLIHI